MTLNPLTHNTHVLPMRLMSILEGQKLATWPMNLLKKFELNFQ